MGILQRLFGTTAKATTSTASSFRATKLDGHVGLEVVGESFHQNELWHLTGTRRDESVRMPVIAVLVAEIDNPYDANAIRVDVNGLPVGHLSRHDAGRYREGLQALVRQYGTPIALDAVIVGGGEGREHLGVWLHHDPLDFGVTQPADWPGPTSGRASMRTGFSEAWNTDRGDNSYDLSWHEDLPKDHPEAIAALRRWLLSDPDPISRHYLYLELEERLYSLGLRDQRVLDEYDTACAAHHGEMPAVRSALIAKWGALPLLSTYRQMCIRRHKQQDWASCRWWADQGIAVYGSDSAREEWVTDLTTRRDRAIAKSEMLSRPRAAGPKPRQPSSEPHESSATVETLTCHQCASAFERLRTRGRKPLLCPDCRQ